MSLITNVFEETRRDISGVFDICKSRQYGW